MRLAAASPIFHVAVSLAADIVCLSLEVTEEIRLLWIIKASAKTSGSRVDDIYVRQRVSHLRQTEGSNRTIVSMITSSSVIASVVKHVVLLFRECFIVRVPFEILGRQLEFVKVVQCPSGRFLGWQVRMNTVG